jgi:hypothetical protein
MRVYKNGVDSCASGDAFQTLEPLGGEWSAVLLW